MAVDEFGREVPAGRARRDRSPSPGYGSPSRGGGGGGNGGGGEGVPSHLFEALPTGRYAGERSSSSAAPRKRKHRSESPPPSGRRGGKSSSKPHPSTLYAEEPMLCQYLWKENNPDKPEEEYDEYRRSYGLNYVRTFFNEHMDDSWYRSLYSPLGEHRVALQERERAAKEATSFQSELETSLSKNTDGRCFFVLKARLGGGIKQARKLPGDDYHASSSSPSKSSTKSLSNPVPATHVLASASQVLPIQDIPPYVTDEQLTTALMNHCTDVKASSLVIYSSSLRPHGLNRTAYLYASEEIRKEIIHQLNHLDRGPTAAAAAAAASSDGAHVPRKEETYIPKTLELEVECSDAYGRLEVDADGKGGAPEEGGVPPRKASVWISTQPLTPQVTVLSAAVSSRSRIQSDQEQALTLAKAYDMRRNIPPAARLTTLLPKAIPALVANSSDEPSAQDLEDALDMTIAYLRRVHLFSFYNGCTTATNVADVFIGSHATSTIHLRSATADEILQQNKADELPADDDAPPAKLDLLVQRLNDSIQKALELSKDWDEASGQHVVSAEADAQAKAIQQAESQVEHGFLEDHAMMDEDGRARCSFHFCRKLFKDKSFLKKHLMKKHAEFLRAEMAKCHDSYMMKAWDAQEHRPVPPILVECGRAFSVVPSPVVGAAVPMAADPEPELWRRQEERRRAEEEDQDARRDRYQREQQHHTNHNGPPDMNGPLSDDRPQAPRHFVDVDDMKEEKVEMAFEDVDIPVQPPKKKKRKKKLL
jgi:hypothetical protein